METPLTGWSRGAWVSTQAEPSIEASTPGFGLGRDPGVVGSSSTMGSPLGRESASLSPSAPLPAYVFYLSSK